jgi:hypothetical protein
MENSTSENNFNIQNRTDDSKYYNLQKMNQLHHEILRRIVLGQKDKDIAESVGCTSATVKYTRESPVVKRKLEIMMGARDSSVLEVRKRIQNLAPLALHKLEEILADDKASESVRMKVAQDLLDRAGYDAVTKTMDLTKFGEDRINEIKKRARRNGLVVNESQEVEEAEVIQDAEE